MAVFKLKLKKKTDVANGTMAFHFDKPKDFTFKPGQFADYTLINPPETDDEGNIRGFSLVDAPYEDEIIFATRMRDTAFKRVMKNMEPGTELTFDGPYGSFTLQNSTSRPAVFLSGGIGITPVRSIVLQATHDKTDHKIFLFYANRTPEDAAFTTDLEKAAEENPNFTFVPSMTKIADNDASWKGERGFFTKEMLEKYIGDLSKPIYYLCGPAGMVKSLRETLNGAGVDDDEIRSEEFSGY